MNKEINNVKSLSDYPDVLTVQSVQNILGIGRKQVYKLIDEGELFAVRPGKSFLISKNTLINYLNGANKRD